MIDEKNIEEAAYIETMDMYGEADSLASGFMAGVHWALNQFLKDLWHDASEVPIKATPILIYFESYITCTDCDYPAYYDVVSCGGFTEESWNGYMNIGGTPSRWLYIKDLLPKEGGEK